MGFFSNTPLMSLWFLFLICMDKIVRLYSSTYLRNQPTMQSQDIDDLVSNPALRFSLKTLLSVNLDWSTLLMFLMPIYEFSEKARLDHFAPQMLHILIPILRSTLLPLLCVLFTIYILKNILGTLFLKPYLQKIQAYKLFSTSPNPDPKSIPYWAYMSKHRQACRNPKSDFFKVTKDKFDHFTQCQEFERQGPYETPKQFLKEAMQSINTFYRTQTALESVTERNANGKVRCISSHCAYNLDLINKLTSLIDSTNPLNADHAVAVVEYHRFMQALDNKLKECAAGESSNNAELISQAMSTLTSISTPEEHRAVQKKIFSLLNAAEAHPPISSRRRQ